MRWGLLADIHSNVHALQATLDELKKTNVDRIAVLGDILGIGPNPEETIEIIRNQADLCVIGDHDAAVLGRVELKYENSDVHKMIRWIRSKLSKSSIEWLGKRTKTSHWKENMFVHGTPYDPLFGKMTAEVAERIWRQFAFNTLFFAHLRENIIITKGNTYRPNEGRIFLEPHTIVGVGSVGWDSKKGISTFAIWDSDSSEIEFRSLNYDGKSVLEEMTRVFPWYSIDKLI